MKKETVKSFRVTLEICCFSLIFSRQPFFEPSRRRGVFLVTCLGNIRSVSYHTKNRMMSGVRLAAVPKNKEGRQVRVTG